MKPYMNLRYKNIVAVIFISARSKGYIGSASHIIDQPPLESRNYKYIQ